MDIVYNGPEGLLFSYLEVYILNNADRLFSIVQPIGLQPIFPNFVQNLYTIPPPTPHGASPPSHFFRYQGKLLFFNAFLL